MAEPVVAVPWGRRLRALLPEGGFLSDDAWRTRHAGIVAVLWLHAAFIPVFALVRGYSLIHALVEGSILPAAALLARAPRLGRRARTVAASAGLLSASAVLVHLSGGVIEMHFHFFVMVALVTLYQDWLPFLAAIAYVFIHHGLVGALDAGSVYNHFAARNNPWKWAGIHAIFVSGLSLVCLVTWRLNESLVAERTRAQEAEHAARLAAEAAGARLALFADATKALTSSFELDVVLADLAHLVTAGFADACVIDLVEPDGRVRRAALAVAPGQEDWADGVNSLHPPPARGDAVTQEALRSGRPQVVEEPECSAVAVPLKGRPGTLGVLWLVRRPSPSADTVELAEELARRASIAVENARLFARQRTVSETLQQSLLPERLPEIPGLTAAARYVPGGPDVDIGGDWYDVVQLPEGGIGLALGDVVGRGERAAALMGQLRNAVRAYAFEGRSPAQVMDHINNLLLEAGSEHMATMIYGVLELDSGEFRFVNAGHPPPLVVAPEGDGARFLDGVNGPPVGALATARYAEARAVLAPGATLLLYTDGLVEDRVTPLEVGLQRLREAAVDGPGDLEAFCSHVMRRVIGRSPCDDDVALLTVQLVPLDDRLHLRIPAQPGAMAPLRSTLRRWLAQAGASETEVYEILTACGEACTNAIRHASGPLGLDFEVDATVADGAVDIRVRDQGTWRERRGDVGGRGLPIIEAYVDQLDITPSPSGTEVRMRRRLALDGELVR